MNYCKTLLLLFCTHLAVIAHAQRDITYVLGKPYHDHKQGHCKALKVIDQRGAKDVVGNLKTGAFNRRTPLVPEKPFDEMLTAYYDIIKKDKPSDDELLFVLYHWELNDNPYAGEIGGLYFDGDFFSGKNDSYKYLGRVDSVYEIKSGFDVTEKLMGLSRTQTSELLTSYAVAKPVIAETYTELEAAEKRRKEKSAYTIYNETAFKKGIYYTFDAFLNHQAVDTPFIRHMVLTSGERKQMPAYYLNQKGKKGKYLNPDSYFAIYDGKDWSVSTDGFAIPMSFENGEFITEKVLIGMINPAVNAMMGGAMFGGAIGGAVAGGIVGAASNKSEGKGLYKAKIDPAERKYTKMRRIK